MHRKTILIEHCRFMQFFKCPQRSFPDIFNKITSTPANESEMYDTLPDALNDSKLCPGYVFVATPHAPHPGEKTQQKIDAGMYRTEHRPSMPPGATYARVDWSRLEIGIEMKDNWVSEDPWDEEKPCDEAASDARKAAFGQILSYAELVFRYQQRTSFYMILFLSDYARLIRFDRSSIIATRKFNYKQEPDKIAQFLWAYAQQSNDSDRGHDNTAYRIERSDPLWDKMDEKKTVEADCQDHARKMFSQSLDENWPRWKLEVNVVEKSRLRNPRTVLKQFLVGKPQFYAPGVAGRGTRGYVAVPLDAEGCPEDRFVWLKDAWRVNHGDIEQEGAILERLNRDGVRFIPTLLCHGDVPNQATDFISLWRHRFPHEKTCPLKRHQHYRLVVKEVGKPLEEFGSSSLWLVYAITCALMAHRDAYVKAKVIHRDISAGNIILVQNEANDSWIGLLADWELSKQIDGNYADGRQPDRTGTWQFMSAHALDNDKRVIVLPDEFESMLHVLLYYAVRFLQHNLAPENVGHFLHDYFDAFRSSKDGYRGGSCKLMAMQTGVIDLRTYNGTDEKENIPLKFYFKSAETSTTPALQSSSSSSSSSPTSESADQSSNDDKKPDDNKKPEQNHPLNHIFKVLLSWFKAYYALDMPLVESAPSPPPSSQSGITLSKNLKQMVFGANAASSTRTSASASSSKSSPASSTPPVDAAQRAKDEELAAKLMSHDAIIDLFGEAADMQWPTNDKGLDRKPKDGYVRPKDQIPTQSMLTGSKKRPLDEPQTTRPPKRSKVSAV